MNLQSKPEFQFPYLVALNIPHLEIEKQYDPCSCVSTAKSLVNFSKIIGVAKNWPINSLEPRVGGVVVTNENPITGHIAVIIGIEGGVLILEEGNYVKCQKTKGRKLNIGSKVIIGFWNF